MNTITLNEIELDIIRECIINQISNFQRASVMCGYNPQIANAIDREVKKLNKILKKITEE